ncbi:Ppx/GppA phosphatase family protein [Desulfofalx alkaliphila]|uniref:Ppx/GppA phosphatase family protein n=1 Tax=Desulfofalx alkaliphila TaxID=105483 RepID=UPI0004E266AF|nr:Ppx/GppA phosphatase family protein [Desulfofalx alkaliphila]
MVVAVLDVGTNSVRLLVADVTANSSVKVLHTGLKTTRLGQGITGGYLMPEAVRRTLAAIQELLAQARDYKVQRYVLAATSAVRDAENGPDFAALVFKETGLNLEVLSGRDEAALSYEGVLAGLPPTGTDKTVVLDVGGGSTEFSWMEKGQVRYTSLKVGAVRLTEAGHDEEYLTAVLHPVLGEIKSLGPQNLVAVGGTATTMAAMMQKLTQYRSDKVHGYRISALETQGLLHTLQALTLEERKRLPGLQPERADIIPAGVRIINRVLVELGCPYFTVSESDLLWGLAIRAFKDCRK